MKRQFFALALCVFLVFCAAGCTNQNNQETTSETQNTSSQNISYKNEKYGFNLNLPKSWEGYNAIETFYKGNSKGKTENIIEIIIRHPLWNENEQRQDIPIYILTHDQWKRVKEDYQGEEDALNLGPAPVGPSKFGENNKYIFAIPARYNYAMLEGYEEVEQILKDNDPLDTFEV